MLVREREHLTNSVVEVIDANRSEQRPAKPRFDTQHEHLELRIAHHAAHILTPTETAEVQVRATYDPRKVPLPPFERSRERHLARAMKFSRSGWRPRHNRRSSIPHRPG